MPLIPGMHAIKPGIQANEAWNACHRYLKYMPLKPGMHATDT